ncbi:hypothetical protein CapIbe_018188 [Capra ibex]
MPAEGKPGAAQGVASRHLFSFPLSTLPFRFLPCVSFLPKPVVRSEGFLQGKEVAFGEPLRRSSKILILQKACYGHLSPFPIPRTSSHQQLRFRPVFPKGLGQSLHLVGMQ